MASSQKHTEIEVINMSNTGA